MNALDELIEIIQMVVDTEEALTVSMNFESIPGWDSVNALRLFSQLENELDQKLSMKDYLRLKTIAELFQFINTSSKWRCD